MSSATERLDHLARVQAEIIIRLRLGNAKLRKDNRELRRQLDHTEKAERAIALDRNEWRKRAEIAEAALASLGGEEVKR